MSALFFLQFLFQGLFVFGQEASTVPSIHQLIQSQTDDIFDSLVKIRRDLHKHPEVSEQEEKTSKKIQEYLLSLGLEVKTNIGGYGVVGILKGAKEGKRIAWRADIDAMPSDVPDVVDFKSENKGVRHICGHDVHTTIGMGIANVLASQKENLQGTIYFVFQPAEENYKGARAMINDGLFDLIQPEEIYALHISPLPTGLIATKPGPLYAYLNRIDIKYKISDKDKDTLINYTKNLLSSYQNVEKDSKFWDVKNTLDPKVGLANPNTIFKNYLTLLQDFSIQESEGEVTISSLINSSDQQQLNALIKDVEAEIRTSRYAEDLLSVAYSYEKDILFNDEKLAPEALNHIANIYGAETAVLLHGVTPGYFGDDFAYFQEKLPGVYFFLGGSNYENGIISMPHTPNFAVDEECIRTGVNYFSSMMVERLND
ncbi:M20 metallopeptidase family protein [Salegentibacter salegens]|uniref:Amidohydrolase n=1 Tax=Salegentibacter salegens TaxID=143223 RepID=A0A1M7ILT3_9FLAO|nr:amidohydrolase [Salegentibacter salegens]PRX42484.1 amidohydrolase [Salegentibacter salegens]SHM41548.1 amidohydrolase [Salegentibacter salegens]